MPERRYFAIGVTGIFSSGKSTLIQTISQNTGAVYNQYDVIPGRRWIHCGRLDVDDELTLLLYEISQPRWVTALPGEWLGWLVMVNSAKPETFREAKSIYEMLNAYSNLPSCIVSNPHFYPLYVQTETWNVDELRIAFRFDDTVPIVECNVKDRESVKKAVIALLTAIAQDDGASGSDESNVISEPSTPILPSSEYLKVEKIHRSVAIVSTVSEYKAHDFMLSAADQFAWVAADGGIPEFSGYSEIDSGLILHFNLYEEFGFPRNMAVFMMMQLVAMSENKPVAPTAVDEQIDFPEGTHGCIALFHSSDKDSVARVGRFLKIVGDYPYILVDLRHPGYKGEHYFPHLTDRLVIADVALNRATTHALMRAFCEQLDAELAVQLLLAFAADDLSD